MHRDSWKDRRRFYFLVLKVHSKYPTPFLQAAYRLSFQAVLDVHFSQIHQKKYSGMRTKGETKYTTQSVPLLIKMAKTDGVSNLLCALRAALSYVSSQADRVKVGWLSFPT